MWEFTYHVTTSTEIKHADQLSDADHKLKYVEVFNLITIAMIIMPY